MKYTLFLVLALIFTACGGPTAKQTAALEALKRLDAHTQTGIVRVKYKELLGEAKYAVNALGKAEPQSVEDKLRAAVVAYEGADRIWRDNGYELNADLIQGSFESAHQHITEAEEMLK